MWRLWTGIDSLSLKYIHMQTHTVHLYFPFSNTCTHTHSCKNTLRRTEPVPFGHIFSLLCHGVLVGFECTCAHVCVCVFLYRCVCKESVKVSYMDSGLLQNMSSCKTCLDSCLYIEARISKSFLSVINNRESWIRKWEQSNWQSFLWWFASFKHWKPISWVRDLGSMTEKNPLPPSCHQPLQLTLGSG